jgi:serine/threonine-protein kinase
MRARVKLGKPPANEAERQYLNADKYLKFGDNVTALRKFNAIVDLFQSKDEDRIYVLLAKDKVDKIRSEYGEQSLSAFLNKRLQDAESARQAGRITEAESIWTSIKTLYEDNVEASVHVAYARKRLKEEDPGPPPWEDPQNANAPNGTTDTAIPGNQ